MLCPYCRQIPACLAPLGAAAGCAAHPGPRAAASCRRCTAGRGRPPSCRQQWLQGSMVEQGVGAAAGQDESCSCVAVAGGSAAHSNCPPPSAWSAAASQRWGLPGATLLNSLAQTRRRCHSPSNSMKLRRQSAYGHCVLVGPAMLCIGAAGKGVVHVEPCSQGFAEATIMPACTTA